MSFSTSELMITNLVLTAAASSSWHVFNRSRCRVVSVEDRSVTKSVSLVLAELYLESLASLLPALLAKLLGKGTALSLGKAFIMMSEMLWACKHHMDRRELLERSCAHNE